MNIGLIIALVALLLVLILGYNIMLQYKLKAEATRRQESARYVALIDATEELISGASYLPYSKELMLCLHNRILDSVVNMHELDPKNKHLANESRRQRRRFSSFKRTTRQRGDVIQSPYQRQASDHHAETG